MFSLTDTVTGSGEDREERQHLTWECAQKLVQKGEPFRERRWLEQRSW